jgi:hypothetical protein
LEEHAGEAAVGVAHDSRIGLVGQYLDWFYSHVPSDAGVEHARANVRNGSKADLSYRVRSAWKVDVH